MKRLLAAISSLFVFFICVAIVTPPALSKTLTVASIAPMSGAAAAWGIAADRGLRMAVDEINDRGGLKIGKDTYTVQVVTMDHRYIPGEALSAAKKAVREGIKFAFGMGAGIMPAMQPVLEENKIINIAAMGAGVEFTNSKCPYTFRSGPSSDIMYSLILPKLVKMFGPPLKIGSIHNNDETGRSDTRSEEKTIRELNLPVEKVTEFVERDVIDFSPVVTRLAVKGVNVIFNELSPAQGASFLKQAWDLGYKGRIGTIMAPCSVETLIQVAGKEALAGFFSGVNWPPGQHPSAKFEKFRLKYLSLYKEDPLRAANDQHAGMEFLAAALEKAGTLDTDRVVKVMYDLEIETVYGPTCMVGKSLGYGIKTQMSYAIPLSEVRDGRLKLIEALRYKE
jgi:branched-chain amino acid transport system substrate-binding protein